MPHPTKPQAERNPPVPPVKVAKGPVRGTSAWWNGNIVDAASIHLSPFTHGLHYGVGAFEGIRAYRQTQSPHGGGAIFRLTEHIRRWKESFKILGFSIPFSQEALVQACVDTCSANKFDECYLRPIAFIGDGPLGVYPGENPPVDVCILAWQWGAYLGESAREGVRLCVSSYVRPHVNSIMTKGKISGQYVTGVLAKCEAKRGGFDEALLLDPEGYLAEGTGENLFIVKEGVVKTAPLNSLLNGITRHTAIEYFRNHDIPVVFERFTRDELYAADECFMTGTAAEITPVREVDRRVIGENGSSSTSSSCPGPITSKLSKEFAEWVRGRLPPYGKHWLTPIPHE